MSHGHELKSRAAMALRAEGYVPLPRWWVTQEQLDLIAYMARQNEAEVTRIRNEVRLAGMSEEDRRKAEIDAAWKLWEAEE